MSGGNADRNSGSTASIGGAASEPFAEETPRLRRAMARFVETSSSRKSGGSALRNSESTSSSGTSSESSSASSASAGPGPEAGSSGEGSSGEGSSGEGSSAATRSAAGRSAAGSSAAGSDPGSSMGVGTTVAGGSGAGAISASSSRERGSGGLSAAARYSSNAPATADPRSDDSSLNAPTSAHVAARASTTLMPRRATLSPPARPSRRLTRRNGLRDSAAGRTTNPESVRSRWRPP